MPKVCHITSAHGPEDVRIFHKECVSLAQAGYEVYLVERGESYDKASVHIVGTGDPPSSRLKRMTQGAKKAYDKALALDCDLYHLHDPELLPYGRKLQKKGKKVVFDSHELTREQIRIKPYLPAFAAKIVSRLYAAYEDRVLRKLDGVIFPCSVNGRFPLPGKRQVYLNNLPRLSEMYDSYDPSAEKDSDTICTIGSLTYNRGIRHLILAAAKAGCRVFLGGTLAPTSFEQEIRNMPESAGVEFLGYLNRDQVKAVYGRSRISAAVLLNVGQYSNVENLPTKAYESMAMGLPVILTRTEYTKRLIGQYSFGVCVDPENIDEFAVAIRNLLDDPDKAEQMGMNGRKAIREQLNWEREAKKLFELYEDILNDR